MMTPTIPFNIADYLYALQQYNLVYNSDFRYFSNQVHNGNVTTYGIPDGWLYEDAGANGSVDFDPDTGQCVIVKSQDDSSMTFTQHIQEFPRWETMLLGKVITAKVTLAISIDDSPVSVILSDGINSNTVTKQGEGDHIFEPQLQIDSEAKVVTLTVSCDTPFTTINIPKMVANVGVLALENLPCIVQGYIGERKQYLATETPPAGEVSICEPSVELDENQTRLSTVLNGCYGTGDNDRSLLPDMRGYFSRAWNNGADIDPDADDREAWGDSTITGDQVSTLEPESFLSHNHILDFSIVTPVTIDKNGVSATIVSDSPTSNTEDEGGNETRPINISELYTLKWA